MNIQKLRYLVEIAACHSISKAAQNLYVSQPYLSKVLKDCEGATGMRLFTRSRHGVTLTDDGKNFIEKARILLQDIDSFEHSFSSQPEPAKMRISAKSFTHPFDALVRMLQEIPDQQLRCSFSETNNYEVITDVYTGMADLGVLLLSHSSWNAAQEILSSNHIAFEIIARSPIYLLARTGHPLLTRQTPLTLDAIRQYGFVFYESAIDARNHLLENIYSDAANRLHVNEMSQVVQITSRAALRDLLIRTDFLSFGLFDVREQKEQMQLVTLPLPDEFYADSADCKGMFCAIYQKNRPLPALAKQYLKSLKKYYGQEDSASAPQ